MERSIKTSQTGHSINPKLSPISKPRLAPKPFSLQKNTSIRSIHAPKTVTTTAVKSTTNQTGKSEAADVSKLTPIAHAQKPPQQTTASGSKLRSVNENTKIIPKTTKESKASPRDEDTPDSSVAPRKSYPASQNVPPKEKPTSEPLQKDDVLQTNHNVSTDLVTNSEQKDEKKREEETQPSVVQKPEELESGASSSTNTVNRWGGPRRSLSTKLTSRFQSGGAPLPPQPKITISTSDSKDDSNKPASSDPELNQTTEPSSRESDEGGLKEDYSGGGSIKRRISLLFDSSQRPEVMTKKEEPDIPNCTGGVKQRIKHWVAEKNSEGAKTEENPQVAPRPRSRR
ncbi:unnamed protein product [Pleuronectes platessa]|uniref:Uncharacterized protein n=1 Tax=Pleuronectes platessa TaxID=8262 RepID=A0A9N7VTE4_PLEPL|nr:unnamed protein product [Pleuronectes platessa]